MKKIKSIKNGIIEINTEDNLSLNRMVLFDKKIKGIVIQIDTISTFVLSNNKVTMDSSYEILNDELSIKANNNMLGKVIDVYGEIEHIIYDEENDKENYISKFAFSTAPSFIKRDKLNSPLLTGMIAIDLFIPIGLGQREAIIGDKGTGKTSIALNSIINQNKSNLVSIYVSIGQKQSNLTSVIKLLKDSNSMNRTIIMNSKANDKLSQYISIYQAMALAESFQNNNMDVLIIYDDLTKHANILREINLSLNRPAGRNAYPSDLFFSHSRVLERSGKFMNEIGGGSITALPIVEIVNNDISQLLPTNIISITDGQIITDQNKAKLEQWPAINIGLSVSRTGSAVQSNILKSIKQDVMNTYTLFNESKKYQSMSMELTDELKKLIAKGEKLEETLIQEGYLGLSELEMFIRMSILNSGDFSSQNHFSINDAINFLEKDKVGSILLNKMNDDKYFKILLEYIKAVMGSKNYYNAKVNMKLLKENHE